VPRNRHVGRRISWEAEGSPVHRYNLAVLDLAIIGAGPAGLLTAARCAEAGLDVVVLEEHARIGQPTHRTGILSLETAEVPDELVLSRLSLARMRAAGGSRAEVRWDGPATSRSSRSTGRPLTSAWPRARLRPGLGVSYRFER